MSDNTVNELLDDLLALTRLRAPLPCDCLRAVQTHSVRRFEAEGATLSFPLLGTFRYREKDIWKTVLPGEILIIPNARRVDIEYSPKKEEEFVALSVVLTDEQLEAARLLLDAPPPTDTGDITSMPVSELISPLSRWTRAMREGKKSLSMLAMVEIVLMLYAAGHHPLLRAREPSIAMRISRMVSAEPARRWSAAEVESSLGLSGPTLRRRLAAESTSLRTIIADARTAEALRLLMTSALPVKTVAGRVGYSSVTSFSRRFTERYGVEPSGFRR